MFNLFRHIWILKQFVRFPSAENLKKIVEMIKIRFVFQNNYIHKNTIFYFYNFLRKIFSKQGGGGVWKGES